MSKEKMLKKVMERHKEKIHFLTSKKEKLLEQFSKRKDRIIYQNILKGLCKTKKNQ